MTLETFLQISKTANVCVLNYRFYVFTILKDFHKLILGWSRHH